jgi:uncharacterized protein DUF4342
MIQVTGEKIKVTADKLYETVKRLIHEGNVRRLIVRHDNRTIMEIPLTVAAVGAMVAPVLAAIAALAALAADYELEIEREPSRPS